MFSFLYSSSSSNESESKIQRHFNNVIQSGDQLPNGKDIDFLTLCTNNNDTIIYLIQIVHNCLRHNNANEKIIIKCLFLIHQFSRNGNIDFLKEFQHYLHIFISNDYSNLNSKLPLYYNKYLLSKFLVYKELQISLEREPIKAIRKEFISSLSYSDLCISIVLLQSQFQNLTDMMTELCKEGSYYPITHALVLYAQEGLIIFSILSFQLLQALNGFDVINDIKQLSILLNCVHLYSKQAIHFNTYGSYLSTNKYLTNPWPDVQPLDKDFEELLEEHIKQLQQIEDKEQKEKQEKEHQKYKENKKQSVSNHSSSSLLMIYFNDIPINLFNNIISPTANKIKIE